MIIRKATEKDIPFLAEAIIAAEKSGTETFSYSRIFGMEEPAFRQLLEKMLEEDLEGQELCISGFLVAEEDGQAAGAVCGWIEGDEGLPSGLIKASLLIQYLDSSSMKHAATLNPMLESVQISRTPGALQLESIYTHPGYRGKGVAGRLIAEHLSRTPAEQAEIIVAGNNAAAIHAYEKAGFTQSDEKTSADPGITQYLPDSRKVKLNRKL